MQHVYGKIKVASYVELGVVTQCVIDDRYKKKGQDWIKVLDPSVIKNLIASINAKMDLENCIVEENEMLDILQNVAPSEIMIMGMDVYHGDTNDPAGKPSIVALCASRNSHFNRYATVLRTQHPRQELVVDKGVDNFSGMIKEIMTIRKCPLPKHIIFYRDGVGEGMYPAVQENEVQALKKVMAEIYYEQKRGDDGNVVMPTITYIIAQKRNHFRSVDPTSRDGNPPPGCLVDDLLVVDGGDLPNFYLYSHKALAGTARPTHYQVLLDENSLGKSQLAHFTYALTHLHQGCTKSVSVPAPVFYADRAAYLAGTCFRREVENVHERVKLTPYMI